MNSLQERIEKYRKMATEDPENELGHFRLGQILVEDNQFAEAIKSFERTLELNPQFSKVYQLLGDCLLKSGQNEQAIKILTDGYKMAGERGDLMPRDAMAKLLKELGAPIPEVEKTVSEPSGPDTGFRCSRPGCTTGTRARKLETPPPLDAELAQRVTEQICSTCWDAWKRDYSIKVINELRLDLSSEYGSTEYDKHMLDFFGFSPE